MKKTHQGTTVPLDETTDIDITDDEINGRRIWDVSREAYSQEIKDFHDCVSDVPKASTKEEKFDEIYYKINGVGYGVPTAVPQ